MKLFITIWIHRNILAGAIIMDFKNQYAGSAFGTIWAFLFPALQLSIFAMLYTVIFKVRPSGLTEYTYTLLVFSGLVPLLMFNQVIMTTMTSIVANKNLLVTTVFPSELIVLRAALAAQIPHLSGFVITILIAISLNTVSFPSILIAPFVWLLLLLFAIGLGWIFSLITLFVTDLAIAMSLILMLTMILSPFAYTPEMVPSTLSLIIYLNPLSYFVLSFQKILVYGQIPEILPLTVSLCLSLLSFFGGYYFFRKFKHVFFDFA